MPELPEVETTRRGIEPHLVGQLINSIQVRQPKLRWPVPDCLQILCGQKILKVTRRAKYLLIETNTGSALVHLGMSGSLRLVEHDEPPAFHDHVDMVLDSKTLRFTDPRRFGCWLYVEPNQTHSLLEKLGPEPLTEDFEATGFYTQLRKTSRGIKQAIMDNHIVVGVGNIYANEALFLSGIHPLRHANRISKPRVEKLCEAIKAVLGKAIQQGGTTLKDFVGGDGQPGYFQQQLAVYGRAGQPCLTCRTTLKEVRVGGRSTVYCHQCQR